MIGRHLSHYHIEELRGSGGMGTVYRAVDTLLDRPVALKFPHRAMIADPQQRERLLREARMASALDHPNVVALFDIGEAEGELFLAMQFVEGISLRERLRAGAPPIATTIAVGRAVADALAHAHDRGVIHRDIKPENVLLKPDGGVKVADFGLARRVGEGATTHSVGVAGTLGYLAPEIASGESPAPASDLFALGAVLHEMITGEPAFRAGEPAAVLQRILFAEPAPLPASTPPALARLVRSLLEKDPSRRPRSAVEVADALAQIQAGAGTAAAAAPGATPDAGPSALDPGDAPRRSIAVLPFDNLTGDPQDDYLCSGITEDLLTEVLQMSDLKVASRTMVDSLRGRSGDLRRAVQEHGIANLLEGGVRRSGQRVRVTARLVQTVDGYPTWAGRYDRDLADIFEVQEDIARQIASALRVALGPKDEQDRFGRRTSNPKAYDLRLRALAQARRLEETGLRDAIRTMEEALRLDPDYALGLADLAEYRIEMVCKGFDRDAAWLDRAEVEARRAAELAPSLPEAHRALGHLWNHRRRPDLALREFHRAVELDPRFVLALMQLANTYVFLGNVSRSEIYLRRARDLDPRDPRTAVLIPSLLVRQGRYDEVHEAASIARALDPPALHRLWLRETELRALAAQGRLEDVRRLSETIRAESDTARPFPRVLLGFAAAVRGDRDEAAAWLDPAGLVECKLAGVLVLAAKAWAALGEDEAAIGMIERANALDLLDADELRRDSYLAPLAGNPRYRAIVESMPWMGEDPAGAAPASAPPAARGG